MITINIDPVIFSLGHFAVRWYGLIVAGAVGAAAEHGPGQAKVPARPDGEWRSME